eukprot:6464234-Pyramimonas_sp.AAC.1
MDSRPQGVVRSGEDAEEGLSTDYRPRVERCSRFPEARLRVEYVAGSGAQELSILDTQRGEVSVKCGEPREPQNPTKSEEYQRHLHGVSYGT